MITPVKTKPLGRAAVFLLLYGCGTVGAQNESVKNPQLVLYSGRNKSTVDPIVKLFEKQTGIKVEIRYGSDAELLEVIKSEGVKGKADLFLANSSMTLGLLNQAQLLQKLPQSAFKDVSEILVPSEKNWLPINMRFRTLAYNRDRLKPDLFPKSILDLPKISELKGRIGWTLTDDSFQSFMSYMISVHGEAVAQKWLEDMKALLPKDYGKENMGMMKAIQNEELDVALTTHVFVQRVRRAGFHIDSFFFNAGDVGNSVDTTAIALLYSAKTHNSTANALKLIKVFSQPTAQSFLLSVNFEYPSNGSIPESTTLLPWATTLNLSPMVTVENLLKLSPKARQILIDTDTL